MNGGFRQGWKWKAWTCAGLESPAHQADLLFRGSLKGFTDTDSNLWVFEKNAPPRCSNADDEGYLPDLYAFVHQGRRLEPTENVLQKVESKAAMILARVMDPSYCFTPRRLAELYVFVALMFTRVPSWGRAADTVAGNLVKDLNFKLANDKDRFYAKYANFKAETGCPYDAEKMRQLVLHLYSSKVKIVQTSPAYNQRLMFANAIALFDIIRQWGLEVLISPTDTHFVTSDRPVFTALRDTAGTVRIGVRPDRSGVELFMPLSALACLRISKNIDKPFWRRVKRPTVEILNRATMVNAATCIYSSRPYKRIRRLFEQYGCRIKAGDNSVLRSSV